MLSENLQDVIGGDQTAHPGVPHGTEISASDLRNDCFKRRGGNPFNFAFRSQRGSQGFCVESRGSADAKSNGPSGHGKSLFFRVKAFSKFSLVPHGGFLSNVGHVGRGRSVDRASKNAIVGV